MLFSLKALLLQHVNSMYLGCNRETFLLVSDGHSSTGRVLKPLKTFENGEGILKGRLTRTEQNILLN